MVHANVFLICAGRRQQNRAPARLNHRANEGFWIPLANGVPPDDEGTLFFFFYEQKKLKITKLSVKLNEASSCRREEASTFEFKHIVARV